MSESDERERLISDESQTQCIEIPVAGSLGFHTPIAAPHRRGRCLYRHGQRAGRLLRGAATAICRPPRRLHRCGRVPCVCNGLSGLANAQQLLANDPIWRRLGNLIAAAWGAFRKSARMR